MAIRCAHGAAPFHACVSVCVSLSLMKSANANGKLKKADAKLSRRNRRFTPVTRQLCLQHHAGGYGYKKISKVTGIPISTIKYHVRKERRSSGDTHKSSGADAYDNGASSHTVVSATAALPAVLPKGSVPPLLKLKQTRSFSFERSATRIEMMHAVHGVLKKNVYAFAHALQHDPHGAPGMMNAADPQMLTLALNLLLQDQWAEHQELAALGRILLHRLHNARDFLRSAISLCQREFPSTSAPVSASVRSPTTKATYWNCPVCSKRLVHTGKCAHQIRCLKKCKVVLTHEQLQEAKAKAAAAVTQSESPEELTHQLKHAFSLKKSDDDKCHQVRYMQFVVAANTSLQQDIDAAPAAILESREAWRVVQSGPNPVIAALALVSLALALQPGRDDFSAKKKALACKCAQELEGKVAEQIASVEAFLKRCVMDASSPSVVDAHDVHERLIQQQQHHHRYYGCEELQSATPAPPTCCTCYRVRISALIS